MSFGDIGEKFTVDGTVIFKDSKLILRSVGMSSFLLERKVSNYITGSVILDLDQETNLIFDIFLCTFCPLNTLMG